VKLWIQYYPTKNSILEVICLFIPDNIYYESNVINYKLGKELIEKYKNENVNLIEIENHNNIEEMRKKENSEFPKMKRNIIIGIRKTHKFVPNHKTSDFLVPYTSSGCTAMCMYCYLVCNYNKCAYLRLFVNREEMLDKIIKTSEKSEKELTFEIGSNSDLILENTITGNLVWTIENFVKSNKGFLTFPTKFDMVDPILNLDHKNRIIIRMSVNPQDIIKQIAKDRKVKKDEIYKNERKLDTSLVYNDTRLRVNVSFSMDVPVFTMRIIKNDLPPFEALGLPEIIKTITYQPQGVILVTGKTNSGKSTTLNALINNINETQNKKILTLESPVEYRHTSKKSVIIQKEVGPGKDSLTYFEGVKNALREDCDILVIGEIRDKETMEAAIDMAESGHLVLGTLHTKSCAETIDRIINFYEIRDQASVKYLISSLLKLVVSQRLLKGLENNLVLLPEIMVVDNVVASCIRKEKFSVSELEDAIQSSLGKGNVSLINSLAELYVANKISLEQAKSQIEEKNIEVLNRTIMQMKMKKM